MAGSHSQLVLYSCRDPVTYGTQCEWCLAELGLEADIKLVDVKGEEHRRGAYAALNPFKKIPTLQDGDYTLTESEAIMLYLTLKTQGTTDPQQIASIARWLLFSQSSLWVAFEAKANKETQVATLLGGLETFLTGDYLLGTFSVADISLTFNLQNALRSYPELSLEPYPRIQGYLDHTRGRPAYKATVGQWVKPA